MWIKPYDKRTRLTKWIQTETKKILQSNYMLSIVIHFIIIDTNRLKVKGWEKEFHANGNQKRAG